MDFYHIVAVCLHEHGGVAGPTVNSLHWSSNQKYEYKLIVKEIIISSVWVFCVWFCKAIVNYLILVNNFSESKN